jgi:hypothetical protein
MRCRVSRHPAGPRGLMEVVLCIGGSSSTVQRSWDATVTCHDAMWVEDASRLRALIVRPCLRIGHCIGGLRRRAVSARIH